MIEISRIDNKKDIKECCKAINRDKWHKKEEEKIEDLENAMLALGHDLDRIAWDMSCE